MLSFGYSKKVGDVILVPYNGNIPDGYIDINCTSWSNDEFHRLSPFMVRDMSEDIDCNIIENIWQYSKVYKEFDSNGVPSRAWYEWRARGFAINKAVRYPYDKKERPLYFYYKDNKYDLIGARKNIYIPLYTKYVSREEVYIKLYNLHLSGVNIAIRDFGVKPLSDTYTIYDAIDNPNKSMCHAYVLYIMLNGINI